MNRPSRTIFFTILVLCCSAWPVSADLLQFLKSKFTGAPPASVQPAPLQPALPSQSVPVPSQSSPPVPAPSKPPAPDIPRLAAATPGDISYENATLTEDTTWRGTVLIKGSVIIAPQATVRIEQGSSIRFQKSEKDDQVPYLVVMGRIQCSGTAEQPVLFAPNLQEPKQGDWGGLLLLSSEKRNLLEHVRIEGTTAGIQALFSNLTIRHAAISRSLAGMVLRDSMATVVGTSFSTCGTGLEMHDSEIDLRDSSFTGNGQGLAAYDSGLNLASTTLNSSEREGLMAQGCRLKSTGCTFSGNRFGALVKGGEGQILMSRFTGNREAGLHVQGGRLKVQRSLISDNGGDGLRVEGGGSAIWTSALSGNAGYNLTYSGSDAMTAVSNWWGSSNETAITAKIAGGGGPGPGRILISPWLAQAPSALH